MNPHGIGQIRLAGGSFRDPNGVLFRYQGRTIRLVKKDGVQDLTAFLGSRTAGTFTQTGRLAATQILDPAQAASILSDIAPGSKLDSPELVLEHETIPFQSYPYEWPFEMLRAAALLTLDLAESALKEGIGLKDAAPYNVLFRGPDAVFVDLLSFEKRNASDPIWLACGQFERTFLIPLLSSAELDLPLEMLLLTKRDGLYPRDAYGIFGPAKRLKPAVLSSVTMPALLEHRKNPRDFESDAKRLACRAEKAEFILAALFRRLRKSINRISTPKGRASRWSFYMLDKESYREEQFEEKERFVAEALTEFKPRKVLDIGCNTGHFSRIAAREGASVVAIDSDTRVIGKLWESAAVDHLDILPLVVNIAQPSPPMGWRNKEMPSFLERAKGNFDAVFMLAVIHHLLVTDRIPLHEILDLIAELTSKVAVLEFVSSNDPMFRGIANVNQSLYVDVTNDKFERACRERFDIVRSLRLSSSERWLYLLRRKVA